MSRRYDAIVNAYEGELKKILDDFVRKAKSCNNGDAILQTQILAEKKMRESGIKARSQIGKIREEERRAMFE